MSGKDRGRFSLSNSSVTFSFPRLRCKLFESAVKSEDKQHPFVQVLPEDVPGLDFFGAPINLHCYPANHFYGLANYDICLFMTA